MNYLESYYTRKRAIKKLFEEEKLPYTEIEKEHTASAWANCNMDMDTITYMKKHPEPEIVTEEEQLKNGVIPK